MNNEEQTIELLKRVSKIEPSKELLQATLKKINPSIKSPYVFSYVQKIGAVFALLIIITGGVVAHNKLTSSQPSPSSITAYNDTSDGALSQDMSNIDDQLSGLDSDSTYVDQAMADQSQ